MPFINGRYYMNPQYGAALERARKIDLEKQLREGSRHPHTSHETDHVHGPHHKPKFSDGLAHWDDTYTAEQLPNRRSYDSHGSEIRLLADQQSNSANQQQYPVQHPAAQQAHPAQKPSQTTHQQPSKSPSQIANSIYNETSGLRPTTKRGPGSSDGLTNARAYIAPIVKSGKSFVASDKLSPPAAQATKTYPPAREAYQDSINAAHSAFAGHDPTGGATHFYLDAGQKPPSWAVGKKPVAVFGPFKNVAGGGDIKKGAIVRIVIIR